MSQVLYVTQTVNITFQKTIFIYPLNNQQLIQKSCSKLQKQVRGYPYLGKKNVLQVTNFNVTTAFYQVFVFVSRYIRCLWYNFCSLTFMHNQQIKIFAFTSNIESCIVFCVALHFRSQQLI